MNLLNLDPLSLLVRRYSSGVVPALEAAHLPSGYVLLLSLLVHRESSRAVSAAYSPHVQSGCMIFLSLLVHR